MAGTISSASSRAEVRPERVVAQVITRFRSNALYVAAEAANMLEKGGDARDVIHDCFRNKEYA
jgi:hypothetical protein